MHSKWIHTMVFMLLGISLHAQASVIQMPQPLQGDWFTLNPEDRSNCAAYRKHRDEGRVITEIFRIGRHDFKDYADYGEGNYYVPYQFKVLSKNTWQAKSHVYLDVGDIGDAFNLTESNSTEPHDERLTINTVFKLKNQVLYRTESGQATQRFFKCLTPKNLR